LVISLCHCHSHIVKEERKEKGEKTKKGMPSHFIKYTVGAHSETLQVRRIKK
jgi:hypothetical protein